MPRFTSLLPALLLLLAHSAAASESEDEAAATSLDGVGRISIQGGWRYTSNTTFRDGYYARPENQGLPHAAPSPGGPLLAATFGYSVTENVELGVDLFASGERLNLTGTPPITSVTYGALVGLRLQTLFEGVGPQGLVPWVGILGGPTLVLTTVQGAPSTEVVAQGWGTTVGASLRLGRRWAATLEVRGVLVRGLVKDLGSVNGGGVWLGVGATYSFDAEPSRPLNW